MVSIFKIETLFLLFSLISLSQTNNYLRKRHPVNGFFSIDLNISPGCWYLFCDTMNEYFILYQPTDLDDDDYKWPERFIDQTRSLVEKGEKTLINYGKQIQTKAYTITIGVDDDSSKVIDNFPIYYTKNHMQDDKVWKTVDRNIRQLSIGLGLADQNSSQSFINELFKNNLINERKFSYEPGSNPYTTFGSYDERKESYIHQFISKLPKEEHIWGLEINRITFDKKGYDIEQFAYINSGIEVMFRSVDVYKMFKSYLQSNIKYENICKETIYSSSVTMECGIPIEEINETLRLNVADEIAFDIPLKAFFVSMNSKKSWMKYVYYDIESDNKINNHIQVGKNFLDLFSLIEFDFDKRSVEFFSESIELKKESLGLFKTSNKKKFNIACNIAIIVLNVATIGYICFTKVHLRSLVQ